MPVPPFQRGVPDIRGRNDSLDPRPFEVLVAPLNAAQTAQRAIPTRNGLRMCLEETADPQCSLEQLK